MAERQIADGLEHPPRPCKPHSGEAKAWPIGPYLVVSADCQDQEDLPTTSQHARSAPQGCAGVQQNLHNKIMEDQGGDSQVGLQSDQMSCFSFGHHEAGGRQVEMGALSIHNGQPGRRLLCARSCHWRCQSAAMGTDQGLLESKCF